MSQEPHQLGDYVDHILEAIERIQRYCAGVDATEATADW